MSKPTALIISGYGLNCEEETAYAMQLAGASAEIVHINDLNEQKKLFSYQIMIIPGGFSYGDDTGAGNAFAHHMKQTLADQIHKFATQDKLILGICNGFQILVALGLVPALYQTYGMQQVSLVANDSARYTARWVDLQVTSGSPWLKDLSQISLPVAHGEGKFFADQQILSQLKTKSLIAAKYHEGDICRHFSLPSNPNGSLEDIAAITDESGRILGMMPHPERAITFTQLPHWTYIKDTYARQGQDTPTQGPGLKLFQNAVEYFA